LVFSEAIVFALTIRITCTWIAEWIDIDCLVDHHRAIDHLKSTSECALYQKKEVLPMWKVTQNALSPLMETEPEISWWTDPRELRVQQYGTSKFWTSWVPDIRTTPKNNSPQPPLKNNVKWVRVSAFRIKYFF